MNPAHHSLHPGRESRRSDARLAAMGASVGRCVPSSRQSEIRSTHHWCLFRGGLEARPTGQKVPILGDNYFMEDGGSDRSQVGSAVPPSVGLPPTCGRRSIDKRATFVCPITDDNDSE